MSDNASKGGVNSVRRFCADAPGVRLLAQCATARGVRDCCPEGANVQIREDARGRRIVSFCLGSPASPQPAPQAVFPLFPTIATLNQTVSGGLVPTLPLCPWSRRA